MKNLAVSSAANMLYILVNAHILGLFVDKKYQNYSDIYLL